jgi:uncharacterized protein YaeQ
MALKSTIFKAELQIADLDRHYYGTHALTVARHPSETDERMMVRILAYALHATESLVFGKGLSADDEPDLWQKDLTGAIAHWIDVGQPDERRIMKACGRAERVWVYTYSAASSIWWNQIASKLERARNLSVFQLAPADSQALAKFAQRGMQVQCMIQDGQVWMNGDGENVPIQLTCLKGAAG